MYLYISPDPKELGKLAGTMASRLIKEAISKNGTANIILATGTSQFETLKQILTDKEIDWSKVTMFHLDEYIGLPISHPASFRKYLKERFIENVPSLKAAYLIDGEGNPEEECKKLNDAINKCTIDVALVGIGENGHLAFNDPPADFDIEKPYIIVDLDEACRKQQLGEGWFKSLDEVPKQAISMSIKQILKSSEIICSVPDQRKANAVRNSLKQPINNMHPATALQLHSHCYCFLDFASSSLLK
jgi:glucosamine-6-phosphate deaminase